MIAIALLILLAIWAVSYAVLVKFHKKLNLFNVVVHENGKYTLLQTIFYFDHFIREIIIDTLYALCIFWVYKSHNFIPQYKNAIPMLLLFLLFVFVGGYLKKGSKVFYDFFQYQETDDVTGHGSHWKMHFLSTLALMLIFILPGTLANQNLLVNIFTLFALLCLIFGINKEMWTNKVWLMHGAREIFTFILTAFVPFYLVGLRQISVGIFNILVLLATIIIAIYLIKVYKSSSIKNLSRAKLSYSITELLASHFFEHFLDTIYVTLAVLTFAIIL